MGETTNRSIRIPDNIWKPAVETAKARGENVSVVIRRALIDYVEKNQ